jgi:hypothetical protein
MEIEATTTEIILPPARSATDGALGGAFGIRRQTSRPHSISLFGAARDDARTVASRSAPLLLGVGIGAALMYYLNRERGTQRRSELGAAIEDLALAVIGRAADRLRAS